MDTLDIHAGPSAPYRPPLWPCLVVLGIAGIANSLHTTVATLLYQRLASQHLSLSALPHPSGPGSPSPLPGSGLPPPSAPGDETPAQALAAKWGTVLWVSVACVSAVSVTFYTLRATQWGRKTLVLIGLSSAIFFELLYFLVARDSAATNADDVVSGDGVHTLSLVTLTAGRSSLLGFSPHFLVLIVTEIVAAALGSYSVVQTGLYLTLFDLSTSKTRTRNVNYLMVSYLVGGTIGPLFLSQVLSKLVYDGSDTRQEQAARTLLGRSLDLVQLAFLASIAFYLLALICALAYLTETSQRDGKVDVTETSRGVHQPRGVKFSLSYLINGCASTYHRLREIAFYQPPGMGPGHRFPLLKLVIVLALTVEVHSVSSFLQLLIDWRFQWGAEENGRYFTLSWGSKLLSLAFLVPWILAFTRRKIAHRLDKQRETGVEEQAPLIGNATADESYMSIGSRNDPSKSINPRDNPSPWIAFFSFLVVFCGWSLSALAIGLSMSHLLLLGTLLNAVGIGSIPAIHGYAVELLSHEDVAGEQGDVDDVDAYDPGHGSDPDDWPRAQADDGSATWTKPTRSEDMPSTSTQRRLDSYVAMSGLLECVVAVVAPLLDGLIYTSTIRIAPWAICAWAASQVLLCALVIATL